MTASDRTSAIEAAIRGFLVDQCYLKPEQVQPDAKLFSAGLLSSLDLLDLTAFLEQEFGIAIDDMDVSVGHLDTPALILAFVVEKGA